MLLLGLAVARLHFLKNLLPDLLLNTLPVRGRIVAHFLQRLRLLVPLDHGTVWIGLLQEMAVQTGSVGGFDGFVHKVRAIGGLRHGEPCLIHHLHHLMLKRLKLSVDSEINRSVWVFEDVGDFDLLLWLLLELLSILLHRLLNRRMNTLVHFGFHLVNAGLVLLAFFRQRRKWHMTILRRLLCFG